MSESQAPQAMSGNGAVIARRYSLALLDLAEEKGKTESVLADLTVLNDNLVNDPSFFFLAEHPQLRIASLRAAIKAVATAAKLDPLTAAFLDRVAINRRLAYLGSMIGAFRAELAERRGQRTAFVTAPKALTEEQKTAIAAQIQEILGGTVSVVVQEDASLLGGLTVKVGSRLIDASIKGKLAQIERHLKTQREAA